MIIYKTSEELKTLQTAGKKLKAILPSVRSFVKPGVTTLEIDNYIEKLIIQAGGYPAFKRVAGYNWSSCLPVNEQLVHTPPSSRKINPLDLITIDLGFEYKGLCVDYAESFIVGKPNKNIKKFLNTGYTALEEGVKVLQQTKDFYQYAKTVYCKITANGYCVIKDLTGHGVGRKLHEDPYIFNFPDESLKQIKVKQGLVVAVEIIYAESTEKYVYESDGWSLKTADNSLGACFEHTLAFVNNNFKVLV
ncbi:MAG: methionine aminopeptidase [Patescibacteria group bacterium]|nr:MAG: methionine aminopeptidase [Patescibacteria group bacterium]